MLPDGTQFAGAELEARLERLMAFQKYLQIVERRGPSRDVVLGLLERNGRDRAFFADAAKLQSLADSLNGPLRTASVQPDEEHQAHSVVIEDRSTGYPRYPPGRSRLRHDQRVPCSRGELPGRQGHPRPDDDPNAGWRAAGDAGGSNQAPAANDTAIGGAPLDDATKLAAEPKTPDASSMPKTAAKGKDADVRIESLDELVDFFIAAGKKGFDINRYKGLGEMNPDTLWETTMDPTKRTLLQVQSRGSSAGGPDVHDADGRSGRAAPQVHRRQCAGREEPRYLTLSVLGIGGQGSGIRELGS